MKKIVSAVSLIALVTGCSTPDPKYMAQYQQDPESDPVATQQSNGPSTVDIPGWYVKVPQSTDEYVWVAGTGISSSLSMARTKAMLDAQVQLADKLNSVMDAVTRQHRSDNEGSLGTDVTTQFIRKKIKETALIGAHLENVKIVPENRGYRTFVLVRYPLLDANLIARDKQRQQPRPSTDNAAIDRELDGNPGEFFPINGQPKAAVKRGEVTLIDVDSEEYKRRRDATLQKPGAVVGQVTYQD